MTNRFKVLDLIDYLKNYGQDVQDINYVQDIVQEAVIKTIPKKNKCKKANWLSEEVV